jgi:peptidoglycan/LPS O-acetylase OafA/YrhL
MPEPRIYALDALRFIAAIGVVLCHWGSIESATNFVTAPYPMLWARYGSFGVELFFLISGFVILMSARQATLQTFVAARAVRLYPAFWICCTLTYVISSLQMSWEFGTFLANMTMLPGLLNAPYMHQTYWSLALEFQFYGLIALLLLSHSLQRIEAVLWAWLIISVAVNRPVSVALFGANYSCYFVGGCACYLLRQRVTATRAALLFFAWVAALNNSTMRAAKATVANHVVYEPLIVSGLVTLFFIVMVLIARDKIRIPKSTAITLAGAMSYPIYLLHYTFGFMFFRWGEGVIDPPLLLASTAAFVLGLSWAVVRFGEPPLQRWMRGHLIRPALPAAAST